MAKKTMPAKKKQITGAPKDVRAVAKGLPPKSKMSAGNKFGKGKGC